MSNDAGLPELLDQLLVPGMRTRYRVRREIRDRPKNRVLAALKTWADATTIRWRSMRSDVDFKRVFFAMSFGAHMLKRHSWAPMISVPDPAAVQRSSMKWTEPRNAQENTDRIDSMTRQSRRLRLESGSRIEF